MEPSQDIFSYTRLSSFLKDYLSYKKTRNREFTLGLWSKSLGLANTASLSRIVSEDRAPGKMIEDGLVDYLKLNGPSLGYFRILVEKQRAEGRGEPTDFLDGKLKELNERTNRGAGVVHPGETRRAPPAMLEIFNGDVVRLVGFASIEKIGLLLPNDLEAIEFNGKPQIHVSFCDYHHTSLGAYHEFYIATVCKKKSASLTGIGLHFSRLITDEPRVATPGRMIWGNHYAIGRLDFDFAKSRCQAELHGSHPTTSAQVAFGAGNRLGDPAPANVDFLGFAGNELAGATYRLTVESTAYKIPFDPENDTFTTDGEIRKVLSEIGFQPHFWTVDLGLTSKIYGPEF